MKKQILFIAVLFAASVTTSLAQKNLGQDCGCPPVSARCTVVNMSTLTVGGGNPELSA